ncbi:MAG: sensor histidine kinase [Clostridium sp.]
MIKCKQKEVGIMMKKDYLIAVDLILALYIGIKGIEKGSSIILTVSFLLVLISIQILDMIFSKETKGILLILAAVIAFIGNYYILSDILIISLMMVFHYFMEYKKQYKLPFFIFVALSIPAFQQNILVEYLLISSLVGTFQLVFFKFQNRMILLEADRECKREEISKLKELLIKNEEYRKHEEKALRLQERNKLSTEMHDKIGHTVSGAILQLEASKIVLNSNKDEGLKLLQNTIKLLRTGVDEIRGVLRETKPASEELGLSKVKLILEEKIQNTNFKYRVNYSGDLEEITLNQWGIIIDAVRELSTNSLKYSGGNLIRVNLEILNKFIKLQVEDNGVGAEKIIKGIGLKSLEEKVIEVGGKFIVDGSKGFSAVVLLNKDGV